MGKHTWEGWQTSVSNAPQPTSILYGANLRQSSKENSQETQQKPHPEHLESEIRNLENNLFRQMTQVQQPMQPELSQMGPKQGESSLQMPSSLELEAAAMRLKLQQNRKAMKEQGVQSASDELRQRKQQRLQQK